MTGPSAMTTPDVPAHSPTASPRIGDPPNSPMMDGSSAPIKLCINITYLWSDDTQYAVKRPPHSEHRATTQSDPTTIKGRRA